MAARAFRTYVALGSFCFGRGISAGLTHIPSEAEVGFRPKLEKNFSEARRGFDLRNRFFWGIEARTSRRPRSHNRLNVGNDRGHAAVPVRATILGRSAPAPPGLAGVVLGLGSLLSATNKEQVAHGEPR